MKPQGHKKQFRGISAEFENSFMPADEGREVWYTRMYRITQGVREANEREAERQAQVENGHAA